MRTNFMLCGMLVVVGALSACDRNAFGGGTNGENAAQLPGPAPLRRLTGLELNNTLRDLFTGVALPTVTLPDVDASDGFANNVKAQVPSDILVEAAAENAETIAKAVMAAGDVYARFGVTNQNDDASGAAFVTAFGRKAFRRPLSEEESARYAGFFAAQRASVGSTLATQLVIQAMLQAPAFLYKVELGAAGSGTQELTAHELANRLAYFLWESMPDDALAAAADSGDLNDPAEIDAQARRMLEDPRARATTVSFARQWLDLDAVLKATKDPTAHPGFDTTMKENLREEALRFASHALVDEGTLGALLTSRRTEVNARVAALYGVPAPSGDQWAAVDLNPSERAGILTLPAFLASRSHVVEPSPVLRGVYVLDRLMCNKPGPPTPGVNTTPPTADDGDGAPKTNRARYAAHVTDVRCAGCHAQIDGIGFGLEGFDSVGRFRTFDNGFPVDATGTFDPAGAAVPFNGPAELAQQLANSAKVERCFVKQWFRFALGRQETADEAGTVDAITDTFASSGQQVKELQVAIATSVSFRQAVAAP